MQNAHAPSDVIILTVLSVECKAVLHHLQDQKEIVHESGTIYYQGTFTGTHRAWRVAVAEIGMGGIAAALEAEKAISFFQAQIALFVGIAGGIKDVKSGDIVAATKIYAYESGKVGAERFAPRPELGRSSHALEQRARAEAKNEEWLARLEGDRPDPVPQVYVGALAAGEKVLASMQSDVARLLKETYGDTLAIEMEGHGFLHAVRVNQQVYGLVIRGISDLIDDKTEADASGAQQRAARHAAAFAFQVLAKLTLLERKSEKVPVDDSTEAVKYPGENQQVAQGPVITNYQGELFQRSDRPAEVPLRTLYLRKDPKILGRESLRGRKLYDRFHEVSERCLLGHRVLPDEEAEKLSYPGSENDICSYSVVEQLNPNLDIVSFSKGAAFSDLELSVKLSPRKAAP